MAGRPENKVALVTEATSGIGAVAVKAFAAENTRVVLPGRSLDRGRHELYEINYAGSHEEIRIDALRAAIGSGQYERWKSFADRCMAEYDLDGWTVPDLVNPDDVSALR